MGGLALTHHMIVTNRHVLDGTSGLQVDTWDGHSYTLGSPLVGRIGDIGFVTSGGYLPKSTHASQSHTPVND